jgi:N-ethylmaleimide reductase
MSKLFTPVKLGALHLPNRMVMAPLTRNRAGEGNVPQAMNVTYYAQRASAGLIISEATQISEKGVGYPATPGIHSREQIEGWQRVTDAVHEAGGRMVLQLWYCGRISHPGLLGGEQPVAPSAIAPRGEAVTYQGMQPFVTPRALETDEIAALVQQYAQAARNAREAGFDGVEVHSANGYLLDQFLRDGSNKRTDQYGGSIENRARFLMEVLAAVCAAWSADRVGVRLSPVNPFNDMYDSDPQHTFDTVAQMISRFGLAYLHGMEARIGAGEAPAQTFDFVQFRRAFNGPYMANGGYDRDRAEATLEAGNADCIAFGVPFLANPDLVRRFASNAPLNAPDVSTFYGGSEKGYTDYPTLA